MQSKQSKKGKMVVEKKGELDTFPFLDGSYDPSYIYKAKMRNEQWREAKIVDVKPLNEHDPSPLPKKPSDF